jgi:hypothetical protein
VTSDGTHPSAAGQRKVAGMLVDFLKSDTTARPWFVRQSVQPPPKPVPAAIVHAPDYMLQVANGSIGSIYGAGLSSGVAAAAGMALPLVPVAPAVFTMDGWPAGPAAATHHDGRLVTSQDPALPGETITLFLVGLGARNPAIAAPEVFPAVRVGDAWAEVLSAGPSESGPGLDLIDFKIPQGTVPGDAWVVVEKGAAASSQVRLAVGRT